MNRAARPTTMTRIALVGVLVLGAACRQLNPEWLGPSDTSDNSDTSDTSDTSPTGEVPPPSCGEPGVLGSGECPAECTACADGICQIDCLDGDCRSGPTLCPQGWSCNVICDGRNSCRDATIACPTDGACVVDCAGRDACRALTVTCRGAACTLLCAADSNTCEGTSMLCGEANGLVSCEDSVSALALVPGPNACTCEAQGCG